MRTQDTNLSTVFSDPHTHAHAPTYTPARNTHPTHTHTYTHLLPTFATCAQSRPGNGSAARPFIPLGRAPF